jgi:hypothetical protein
MWKSVLVSAMLWAFPAKASDWQYDAASDTIFYGSMPVAQWYGERPSMHPKPWLVGPQRVARCPHRLCDYPIPIYKAREARPVARTYRVSAVHAAWCAGRHRSYDVRTDSYQPLHGARRYCRSPYR